MPDYRPFPLILRSGGALRLRDTAPGRLLRRYQGSRVPRLPRNVLDFPGEQPLLPFPSETALLIIPPQSDDLGPEADMPFDHPQTLDPTGEEIYFQVGFAGVMTRPGERFTLVTVYHAGTTDAINGDGNEIMDVDFDPENPQKIAEFKLRGGVIANGPYLYEVTADTIDDRGKVSKRPRTVRVHLEEK